MKLKNNKIQTIENTISLRNISPDASGGYTFKNVGMTTLPMEYEEGWEAATEEELDLIYQSWVGMPVFATPNHPKGDTVLKQTENNTQVGSIINAERVGKTIIFKYYITHKDGVDLIQNGSIFTSTCYGCNLLKSNYVFDNADGRLNTNSKQVRVVKRHVGIVPLHVLITDRPRAGAITLVRSNTYDKKNMEELLATLTAKVDELVSNQKEMKGNINTLMDGEPKEITPKEEPKEEPKDNNGAFDMEKFATLMTEKLTANNSASPSTEAKGSLAEQLQDKWKD